MNSVDKVKAWHWSDHDEQQRERSKWNTAKSEMNRIGWKIFKREKNSILKAARAAGNTGQHMASHPRDLDATDQQQLMSTRNFGKRFRRKSLNFFHVVD